MPIECFKAISCCPGPLLKFFNLHGVGDVEVHAMGLQEYAGLTRAEAIDQVNASLAESSSSLHG